jgi:hypothetical protein
MFRRLCYLSLALIVFINCKSEQTQKKETNLQSQLDSIDIANTQSVLASGENVTKAYINQETDELSFWADMKKDHRFFGYAQPDTASKRLLLFSIFSNDVEGNPFQLPLGAYYDTRDLEDRSIAYLGQKGDFIHTQIEDEQGEKTDLYFEKKWVVLDDEKSDTDDDYNPDVSEDAIRSFGLIEKYTDGAYPMYIVTIDFVEKNYKQDFDLNIEAVSIDSETLSNLVGKYVSFYYTSDWVEDINDLYFDGKSLSGKYAPELDKDWSVFKGTLSGAESLSGDLPNIITITNEEGESMNFEWYVDDKVAKANDKEVTAYYSGRAINTIVSIEPSKN